MATPFDTEIQRSSPDLPRPPAPPSPQPELAPPFFRAFAEPDELAAAIRHARAEIVRCRPGPFRGSLLQLDLGSVFLQWIQIESPALTAMVCDPSRWQFWIPIEQASPVAWNGRPVTGHEIVVLAPGAAHRGHQAAAHWVVAAVAPGWIERVSQAPGRRRVLLPLSGQRILEPGAATLQWVRAEIARAHALAQVGPWTADQTASRYCLATSLLVALGRAASVDCRAGEVRGTRSTRVVERAEGFLRDHAGERLRVANLARMTGTGERQLQRAFHAVWGLCPKRYLKIVRLNSVRRALLAAPGPGLTVTAAAAQFGFWDLGRFASEYRRLFDELPSQTRARRLGLPPAATLPAATASLGHQPESTA